MITILYLLFISGKMTIWSLVGCIGLDAILLTSLLVARKKHNSVLTSLFQNFCGLMFIFSGIVKVIDPLGTAYKLEQYFGEFETHFSWFASVFTFFSQYAVAISVLVIVFEIVLGIMLILGSTPKLTSWLFFGLVLFFTGLTGFTYLTGHLTDGATFFEFGKWGPWVETNMKVTDCGCFGDFIKLKPFTSFMKDIGLMIPAIYFLFKHKDMHQLFSSSKVRSAITNFSWLALGLFAVYNFYWNLPIKDFRPFQNGIDINAQRAAEAKAQEEVPLSYVLTNKSDGKAVELPMDDYLKVYKDYPKEEWDIDQKRGEPTIPFTKISEFEVEDMNGNDMTEAVLNDPNYSFMIVSYKLYNDAKYQTVTYADTTWAYDTIDAVVNRRFVSEEKKTTQKANYIWDKDYQERYTQYINPLAAAATKSGMKTQVLTKLADPKMLKEFQEITPAPYPFYMGDDIMLKTIVRSNPGILLMKNGKIIQKWHYKKLPSFENIKKEYMK